MNPVPFEIGIYTFGERTPDPASGQLVSAEQRIRDLLEEVELADQAGLDVFGLGEHHRPDYVVSNPAVVLGAAAARTRRIRLSSAVTVLGTDDPVRVFQAFSTLDLISGGRAEIMAGRGSFIESFPLFVGNSLELYDELFAEKLDLLLKLRAHERVTWSGRHRTPALRDQPVYPRPLQDPLPVWLAVGGTPPSAVRAGTLGLPMALAIIGGQPERFVPFVELYRDAARRAGHDPARLPLGINSHGYVADTSQRAADEFYAPYAQVMTALGRERGWPPTTRAQYEALRGPRGALLVGDPQQVAEKILFEHELFGHTRFLMQMSVGTLPHAQILRSIELLGTEVAPLVRREIARRTASPSSSA
ncbi:putative LLM family oxidoreductase [Deinobacterium chartae]|uniref:Putative LLM family oxidoreductase n=1 Tax=Deinobacterium chartae TaxID=521158 RepID=A0A841I4G5_9DEIO|nr:LLM class flavin-dependent oxidoreductase [Deinobacterium chartae]MBB6099916.1 putative LLM family oxidoreductase [Deinobacterium chartae]